MTYNLSPPRPPRLTSASLPRLASHQTTVVLLMVTGRGDRRPDFLIDVEG